MWFGEYELRAETLCLGERLKGGLFRPCDQEAIRYSAVTGALRSVFGRDDLHAAGYFLQEEGHNRVEYLVYAPRDAVAGVSKLPLTIQFLADALGRVVVQTPDGPLLEVFELSMGAMKSKGFGRCRFRLLGAAEMGTVRGRLRTRLPLGRLEDFRVEKVIAPVYGYLFEPTSPISGEYVLSLFEGSSVHGPQCLVQEERL